jgi:uncharacterized protein (TIGR03437 family)
MISYRKSICWLIGFSLFAPSIGRAQPPAYIIDTVVGNNTLGYAGDGGPAIEAELNNPCKIAVDQSGNLYIADQDNFRIRKVSGGVINTIAGTGTSGYDGDTGAATSADISSPCGVAVDHSGNVYLSQTAPSTNAAIREVGTNGIINTIAGTTLGAGFSGDAYLAIDAQLNGPTALAVDSSADLFIADTLNNRVREIQASNQYIYTEAGNGDNPPLQAQSGVIAWYTSLNNPEGVAVDASGDLFIADTYDHCVREVYGPNTNMNHVIVTIAGICGLTGGYSGDGGPATQAQLNYPEDVAVDASGNVYIVDTFNSRIREVTTDGNIYTIAGRSKTGYTGDGGLGTNATLNFPSGIALGPGGIIYIDDQQNNVIRLLTPSGTVGNPIIPPIISSINSASACGDYAGVVSPGSWIEVHGTTLATDTRSWTSADFNGNIAPTSLDGTTVSIAGQNAVLDYISPTQVNALVPLNISPGTQSVQVTSPSGTSPALPVTVNAATPGLCYHYTISGTQYLTAVVNGTSTYILPSSANASGISYQPAKPGETITFFGNGFGPVTPAPPQGQIVQQTNQLTMPLQVFFGSAQATVQYAGLAPGFLGLYQFNVIVPNIPSSDVVPVTFALGDFAGAPTLYTSVQQ